MDRHMLVLCILLILFVAFLLWSYLTMINIQPKVDRPKLDKEKEQVISDLENRLKKHVTFLAEEIGERNLFIPERLNKAALYIQKFWQDLGYEVKFQSFPVEGVNAVNLSVEIQGKERAKEIIIIGAHYDSVAGSPGADDNASAVASLLEISRLFNQRPPPKTLRLVAFANEEPPFYHTQGMGSLVYAQRCHELGENILGMLSLETIGYYNEQPKSQFYPPPLGFFYPDKGNFIAVVGNLKSRPLVISFTRSFLEGSDFPVECVAIFGLIPGVSWSDHSSFWKYNYPAIMITDTAFYRNPFYHTSEDTLDKINFSYLARVTYGIFFAAQKLAN